jgi:D-glycero-D-manno-heptose 1,7-bisphosphate phosphatase
VQLLGVPTAGDSLRDLQAGAAAGCEPHLVLTGKSAHYRDGGQPEGLPAGTLLHADLAAFADFILERGASPLLEKDKK